MSNLKLNIQNSLSSKVKQMMTEKTETSHDDYGQEEIDDLRELLLETEAVGTKIS